MQVVYIRIVEAIPLAGAGSVKLDRKEPYPYHGAGLLG